MFLCSGSFVKKKSSWLCEKQILCFCLVIKKLILVLVVCRQQMNILRESGKCQSVNDILPLVQVRDVMQFMPQMKYMFSRMNAGGEENPSKRQRTS